MTRIIAGFAKGTALEVPGSGTRPTSDRVRESLFGGLEASDLIEGARVLDLYAGSGALGLESASRGAASVDLVDMARAAVTATTKNAARVAKAGAVHARVHAQSVSTFLRSTNGTWDLVFLDPPYDVTDAEFDDMLALLTPHLSEDAIVIAERAKRSAEPNWAGANLDPVRDRNYGDTTLWWAQPSEASQS